jgi:hypothetical protein
VLTAAAASGRSMDAHHGCCVDTMAIQLLGWPVWFFMLDKLLVYEPAQHCSTLLFGRKVTLPCLNN